MPALETEMPDVAHRMVERVAQRVSSSVPLLGQIAAWMDLVEICRELDHWISVADKPTARDLSFHRAILALALGRGEFLMHTLKLHPVDLSAVGTNEMQLGASLQMLSDSFVVWHNDLSAERREEIIREVFGAAA